MEASPDLPEKEDVPDEEHDPVLLVLSSAHLGSEGEQEWPTRLRLRSVNDSDL